MTEPSWCDVCHEDHTLKEWSKPGCVCWAPCAKTCDCAPCESCGQMSDGLLEYRQNPNALAWLLCPACFEANTDDPDLEQ